MNKNTAIGILIVAFFAGMIILGGNTYHKPAPIPTAQPGDSDNLSVEAIPEETQTVNYDLQLRRPTFAQVEDFLAADNTSDLELTGSPVPGQPVNCLTYSTALRENAIGQHLWVYIVIFNWNGGPDFPDTAGWHAINAFDTTDRGLVYVEPSTEKVVDLKIGYDYSQELCATGKWCPVFPMVVLQISMAR